MRTAMLGPGLWAAALGQVIVLAMVLGAGTALAQPGEPKKVLKLAYRVAETSFDPAAISDLYSRTVTPHIFEALYTYDHLARPAKIKPLLATAMPTVSADFRTYTIQVRPGVHYQSDEAFKGKKREVVAQDFVYAVQRMADPANKSPLWTWVEGWGVVGLTEARLASIEGKTAFDYDKTIEGVRALDRYTLQYTLKEPRPRFIESIASSDLLGAQTREVVEFYGDKIGAHPVGTGPFRLKQWRRSSLIVLERNPDFREMLYDAEAAADDAEGQALLKRFKGRKLPMVDEVQISIIEEAQPFWLSFQNAQIDIVGGQTGAVPGEYVNQAVPGGVLAPNLAKRGLRMKRQVNADTAMLFFNMEDPVVGGYTPDRVALRRAISLGMNIDRLIRLGYRGQAVPAQSPINPHTTGYDASFKSEMSDYDVPRAKALLDLFGYTDKNGDGWRDQPDGQPLVLTRGFQADQTSREFETLWKKDLDALGLRTASQVAQWPEQLKLARAGKLQIWGLGSSAAAPDGIGALQRLDGRQSGNQNLARFKNARMDAIYDELSRLPDGPARLALFEEAKRITVAYMPYRNMVHRISTDMWHPWVVGFRRPVFWQEWYHMVDIDLSQKPAK
jgi:ABC-type transport system substrate-binding protein